MATSTSTATSNAMADAATVAGSARDMSAPSAPSTTSAPPAPAPPYPPYPPYPPSAPTQDATGDPAALETTGILTIHLAAIANNWKALARRVVPADCAAVVKADAYGCGMVEVAAELAAAGCRNFFVADLAEARRLRHHPPPAVPDAAIYVLNGIAPGTAPAYAHINARPVIGSVAEYVEWDAFRIASGWRGGAALHFDTGMNRLGLPVEAAATFAARAKMPDHGFALIMSHLACADTPDHKLNARQIAAFRDLRFLFRGIPASLVNSSGIFLGPAAHCDMVRPGAALYGVNPTPATVNLMEPAVSLKARIVAVRDVARGATVGYGATWTAGRAARIAIVSAGYADGYPRAAAGAGGGAKSAAQAIIASRRCALIGRISMDLMAFDVTGLPEQRVRRGDLATLIGDGITVDKLAQWSGTIGYEVLTRLGHRYRRVWVR